MTDKKEPCTSHYRDIRNNITRLKKKESLLQERIRILEWKKRRLNVNNIQLKHCISTKIKELASLNFRLRQSNEAISSVDMILEAGIKWLNELREVIR